MSDNTVIKTTKTIYPQIYAYVIPKYKPNEGWVKIGYTERKNVDERIRQQTQTAGISYSKLWSEPAKFWDADEWFLDKQLHAYLRKFKKVEQRPNTEWFYYNGIPEQSYTDFNDFRHKQISQVDKTLDYILRKEQLDAVQMTLDYAAKNQNGEFLWNAKPRFGKTLTTYDLARQMNAQKVLIVTNRPAIANSWFDDFEKFIAWQTNYRFVSTTDSLKERPVLTREQFIRENRKKPEGKESSCIAFVSLQDLKGAISFGGYIDKLKWIKDLKWDLLVIDEAHEGVDTFKTDIAFNNITTNFTLHLSGTPFKAVASGKFTAKQIYNWTYADEQDAKAKWQTENEENNPYEGLPKLNLFSYQMSQMITDEVNIGAQIEGVDTDFAFDLNEFFATRDNGKFIHEAEVLKWLDTLTRNEKYPFSTPELRAELKHTFWLLNRVASAKALEKLLREHPVFEHYKVILAAGDIEKDEEFTANQKSLDRVRAAIKTYDRTITLSVGQLTTGVTVPEWTGVMMLSNIKSPSLYMQSAFRAQNQWSYNIDGKNYRKQNAYVFDFAPERTLIIYDEFANNLQSKTAGGGGTQNDRENNIRTLLNFFPVISEDEQGKMIELDVRQVLTIPKTIKAQEVVKRGFMSNLLFQNISGVFASQEARDILQQLTPVESGKPIPIKKSNVIDTKGVEVDNDGNAKVDGSIVIATTNARFGEKIYTDVLETTEQNANNSYSSLTNTISTTFTGSILDTAKEFAKENTVTFAQAEQVVKQNANILAREVENIKKQSEIIEAELKVEYNREIAEAANNEAAIKEAKERFEAAKQQAADTFKQELVEKVASKTKELTQKTTEDILIRAEEKKKTTVEDDIRARLRGFARSIPSFLMAYGTMATTLSNFDTTINDGVFKDITGITLEQFRLLRDTYNFFDEVVFNESVQEFLNKKSRLANYFDDSNKEDIFDYIPPQKTNQIYTPKNVVKLMIDKLQQENPDLFMSKDTTFADLYVKSGLFLTEIVKRLYVGLEKSIPDKKIRLKHILEKQIYGFAPSEIIYNIARNFIFSEFTDISSANLQCLDLTETAKNGGTIEMKFDVVVGNPPYQEEMINTSDTPIYHFFYDLAEQTANKYCLISPARFLSGAGKTPTSWNEKILKNKHTKVVFFEQNSGNIFPNTDIKGGIAVLLQDKGKDYGGIGIFTSFKELTSIAKKVTDREDFSNIISIIYLQQKFNLDALYLDYPNLMKKVGSQGREKRLTTSIFETLDIFYDSKQTSDLIGILGLIKNQRIIKYIKSKYLEEHYNLDNYKVLVPKSNGSGAIGEVLSTPLIGEPLIGEPLIGFTQSFISIGNFKTRDEAESCLKYIKTKFARTMLGILKVTQDNNPDTWAKVPLQDFTQQSDIDWTQSVSAIDKQLYKKYGLDQTEISFIEEKVKAME